MFNGIAKNYYDKVHNEALKHYDSNRANKIALSMTKNKFTKVENTYIARAEDFSDVTVVTYEFTKDSVNISRDADGNTFYDYILSSGARDGHGTTMGPMFLNSMVDQINNEGLVGRVEDSHGRYHELLAKGLSDEEIEEILSKETGIKAVSAKLVDGKVVAKVKVSKEVLPEVDKYVGASIEATLPSEAIREGVVTQGRLQGFILTNTPSNPESVRV